MINNLIKKPKEKGDLAQSVECTALNHVVEGSIVISFFSFLIFLFFIFLESDDDNTNIHHHT